MDAIKDFWQHLSQGVTYVAILLTLLMFSGH